MRRPRATALVVALGLATALGAASPAARLAVREDVLGCLLPGASTAYEERLLHIEARATAVVELTGPPGVPLEAVRFSTREPRSYGIARHVAGDRTLGLHLGALERRIFRTVVGTRLAGPIEIHRAAAGLAVTNRTGRAFAAALLLETRSGRGYALGPLPDGGALELPQDLPLTPLAQLDAAVDRLSLPMLRHLAARARPARLLVLLDRALPTDVRFSGEAERGLRLLAVPLP